MLNIGKVKKRICMCIYYKNKEGLTYKTREHIILSGIGGIKKLPKGFVSDKFNKQISPLENSFLRNSFLTSLRTMLGPGVRGSLNDNKQVKTKINVFPNKFVNYPFVLGYMKNKNTYLIPNLLYNTFEKHIVGYTTDGYQKTDFFYFREKLKTLQPLKTKFIKVDDMPVNLALFGISDMVEKNFNSFIAMSNLNITKNVEVEIENAILNFQSKENKNKESIECTPRIELSIDDNHYRIIAKMAFNFLAYIKGCDYVLKDDFDMIRTWILDGGKNEYAIFNLENINPIAEKIKTFNNYEHSIWLRKEKQNLKAFVNLYGKKTMIIELSKHFNTPFEDIGLICDWNTLTPKEYTIKV